MARHGNTAYWPERYTPLTLLEQAARWREKARLHLDAAAKTAALQHLEKNARRATDRAAELPTAINLNAAGSISNLAADSAATLAEDLAALRDGCPTPPAFAVVYREPGEPPSWVAEVYTICGHERCSVFRTWSPGPATKEEATAALRQLAQHADLARQSRGGDYHAARVRAGIRTALECDPTEVRIRIAGEDRPDDWEAAK